MPCFTRSGCARTNRFGGVRGADPRAGEWSIVPAARRCAKGTCRRWPGCGERSGAHASAAAPRRVGAVTNVTVRGARPTQGGHSGEPGGAPCWSIWRGAEGESLIAGLEDSERTPLRSAMPSESRRGGLVWAGKWAYWFPPVPAIVTTLRPVLGPSAAHQAER